MPESVRSAAGLQRGLHADERHVERRPQVGDGGARRRVAGDDDQLCAARLQLARDRLGAGTDLGRGPRAVREVRRVGEVDDVFAGQQTLDFGEDGEAAGARIEYAYG